MYEFDSHIRHLANLENSVRDARQQSTGFPKPAMQVISVAVAVLLVGTVITTGVI